MTDQEFIAATGKVSHDEALELIKGYCRHAHKSGPVPTLHIPPDLTKDPDLRLSSYILQMRELETERDALAAAVADAEVALDAIIAVLSHQPADREKAQAALDRFRNRGKAPTP
jgi:hypothetical protein